MNKIYRKPRNVNLDEFSLKKLIDFFIETKKATRQQTEGVEGLCLVWTGAKNNTLKPIIHFGYEYHVVPRLVYSKAVERLLSPNEEIIQTCGNPLCIEPKHLALQSFDNRKCTYQFRIDEETWERLEKFKVEESYRLKRNWKTATIRKAVMLGAEYLNEHPISPLWGVEGGVSGDVFTLRVNQEDSALIEEARRDETGSSETDYNLLKRLLEVGLQLLEKS